MCAKLSTVRKRFGSCSEAYTFIVSIFSFYVISEARSFLCELMRPERIQILKLKRSAEEVIQDFKTLPIICSINPNSIQACRNVFVLARQQYEEISTCLPLETSLAELYTPPATVML